MTEIDAIVVLTVGRSRSTTHFHLKWAKTLGKQVLVLASCRNEDGVAIINEVAAIYKHEFELITYTDHCDSVVGLISDEVIARQSFYPEIKTYTIFAGGDKAVYCNVFQKLKHSENLSSIEIITEPEMLESTEFTIEDWVIANESPFVKYLPSEKTLVIESTNLIQPIRLTEVKIGQLTNPTRLTCTYQHRFDIEYNDLKKVKKELLPQRRNLSNFIQKMNLVFTDLGLSTEFRIEIIPVVHTNFDALKIYYDPRFLARTTFLALTSAQNYAIQFDGKYCEEEKVSRLNEIVKSYFKSHDIKRHDINHADYILNQASKYLVGIEKVNLSVSDSMKWLSKSAIRLVNEGRNSVMVDSGYNGRELAKIVSSSENKQSQFGSFEDFLNPELENANILSAFVIALNVNFFLNLTELQPFPDDLNLELKYSEDFKMIDWISIHRLTSLKGPKVDLVQFSFEDGNVMAIKKDTFAEFLFAITMTSNHDDTLVETKWGMEGGKIHTNQNHLYDTHRIPGSRGHATTPDGFRFVKNGGKAYFEIWDMHSTYGFSDGILKKFAKYEKLASKFPVKTKTCVFTTFGTPGYAYNKQDEAKMKSDLEKFVGLGKSRKVRVLDLRRHMSGSETEPMKISLKMLREFLTHEHMGSNDILFYHDWLKENHSTSKNEEE